MNKNYPKVKLKNSPIYDEMQSYRFHFAERFGRQPTDEEAKEALNHVVKKHRKAKNG